MQSVADHRMVKTKLMGNEKTGPINRIITWGAPNQYVPYNPRDYALTNTCSGESEL